MELNCKKN